MSKLELVPTEPAIEAERIEPEDDRPQVGSWWWIKAGKSTAKNECDLPASRKWLGCVIEVGSNYAKLRGIRFSKRIALDDMPKLCEPEASPHAFIDAQVARHRDKVRKLMAEIQRVCRQLGVPFHQALAEAEAPTQALAVAHGVDDVKKYQKALVKAKDKTLPELFKKVREQHEHMATWMKAELIPAEAELSRAKEITNVISDKIHTVELYAGLQEKLICLREGEPAEVNTKVHLMQRRCYMDEECLANYTAGGMDFENLKQFGKWIARDENMTRILPHERCIVAMRIRRHDKDYGIGDSLSKFIRFQFHNQHNKKTFLFIRNGRQLWAMDTSIEFDEELFPRKEETDLLGADELWCNPDGFDADKFITGRRYASYIQSWREERAYCAQVLWQWHRAGKPNGKNEKWSYTAIDHTCEQYRWKAGEVHEQHHGDPRRFPFGMIHSELDRCHRPDWKSYQRVTPENIYYDDAMKQIARAAFEHNRVAVIVQGLLDRSTCLHPHPPWRIWTPEGFDQGIELVYDSSLAITVGDAPSWEGYRAQLNKSIRPGCFTIGQRAVWEEEMEDVWGEKWRWHGAVGDGPERIDEVHALKKTGKAQFKFTRRRQKAKWVPAEPGYIKPTYPEIPMNWWCPVEHLTCIDAYTPGDYHMFFDDPRTRAQYIKWAPILLSAEDWHHERRSKPDEEKPVNIFDDGELSVEANPTMRTNDDERASVVDQLDEEDEEDEDEDDEEEEDLDDDDDEDTDDDDDDEEDELDA